MTTSVSPLMAAEQLVAYIRISTNQYQNFIKNWDDKNHPLLVACIDTAAHYDAVFHPAPVIGGKKAFAPDATLYEKEQILIIARVMKNPENMDKVFVVKEVSANLNQLTILYQYDEPKNDATSQVKNFLALQIPKISYAKVTIYENDKMVAALKPSEKLWSIPEVKAEP